MSKYMEDISGLCERFSLTVKEDVPFDFESAKVDVRFYLVTRFMTSWVLNIESVVRTFKPLCRLVRGFMVQDIGNNMSVFVLKMSLI